MLKGLKALACATALVCLGAASAAAQNDLVMAVWGGGGANTWREAFIKQFAPASGYSVKMVEVPNPAGALRSPERVGFAVDMRPADGQSHLARVMRKDAPPERGWNITLSSTGVLDVVNPVTSLFLNAACEKASAGWPCDAKLEELRDAFAREPDAARRQAIADEIQVRAMREGTHYPLGEWFGASAVSARTSGWVRPPSATAFWNVEVKR